VPARHSDRSVAALEADDHAWTDAWTRTAGDISKHLPYMIFARFVKVAGSELSQV